MERLETDKLLHFFMWAQDDIFKVESIYWFLTDQPTPVAYYVLHPNRL